MNVLIINGIIYEENHFLNYFSVIKLNILHPSPFFPGIAPRESDETFLRIFIEAHYFS